MNVEAQRALIDQLDLRRINMFCQDLGGPISLRNASDQTDRYARLFIGNTWLHHDGYIYTDGIRQWRQIALDPGHLVDDMPTGLIVSAALRRPGHDTDALRVAYDAPFIGIESKASAGLPPWCIPFAEPEADGSAWQQRCFEQMPSLGIPVQSVWGHADHIFTWEWAEQWASTIPGAALDRIHGAGHFLQENAPDDCVDAVFEHARKADG